MLQEAAALDSKGLCFNYINHISIVSHGENVFMFPSSFIPGRPQPAVTPMVSAPSFGSRFRIHFDKMYEVDQKYVADVFMRKVIRQMDDVQPDPSVTSMYAIAGVKSAEMTISNGRTVSRDQAQHVDVVVFDQFDRFAEQGFAVLQDEWKDSEGRNVLRMEKSGKIEKKADYEQAKAALEQEYRGRIPGLDNRKERYSIDFMERSNIRYSAEHGTPDEPKRSYEAKDGTIRELYGI